MSLTVYNLSKNIVTGSESVPVLSSISFSLEQGQTLAIVGSSGSGKSTLLHILGCLDEPDDGRILYGDTPIGGMSRRELARFRREYIGFIFQDDLLLPQLTALENVLLPAMAEGRPLMTDVNFAKQLLGELGLQERMDYLPSALSGGEKVRTTIARALIKQPSLILADEPTGNLDPKTAENTLDAIVRLQKQYGPMLIMATDSPTAAEKMDRKGQLINGTLLLSEPKPQAGDAMYDPNDTSPVAALPWEADAIPFGGKFQ